MGQLHKVKARSNRQGAATLCA